MHIHITFISVIYRRADCAHRHTLYICILWHTHIHIHIRDVEASCLCPMTQNIHAYIMTHTHSHSCQWFKDDISDVKASCLGPATHNVHVYTCAYTVCIMYVIHDTYNVSYIKNHWWCLVQYARVSKTKHSHIHRHTYYTLYIHRLILIVGLTDSYRSNLYQNCSLVNFNLVWDRLVIDLKVPVEKTKSLWSSRTS